MKFKNYSFLVIFTAIFAVGFLIYFAGAHFNSCLKKIGGFLSDDVVRNYATREDAIKDRLFERGQLPDFIPQSAQQITTHFDVDVNIGHGEFHFLPADTNDFVSHLNPYSASGKFPIYKFADVLTENKRRGYNIYEYSVNQHKWIFFIKPVKGHTIYYSWPIR